MSSTAGDGLPRRFLRPLLLLSLQRCGRSYGYELAESVRSLGLHVDLGGVYRDLRSMEHHDLVTSGWEPSGSGPHRRIYELTPDGELAAVAAHDELGRTARLLDAALSEVGVADGSRP